jgi:transposase
MNRTGAISKCGDEMMRAMLYEAAQIMLVRTAKWSWLKAWAMKIARHRGTVDTASAAGRKLKSTYPMLQIEIYDAATKARTLLS